MVCASLRRLTRATTLFVAWYNFAQKNEAVKNQTSAMASKLTDLFWNRCLRRSAPSTRSTTMPANRRSFLKSFAAATALPAICGFAGPLSETKLTLSAPLTHSDWMLKPHGPEWDIEGVQHMLDAC